ncbi:hypothetical protein EV11_1447 [Prochlorococcus sp. SS52]|nr:hypothetical protein EV04_0312 [Prochlorococcus marinus str. LG]KGG18961.1 hypothetical protein EV08_1448 [Prochlorococcus marinus str. SS2]KGG23500.1 hypothetical protein EV09_1124 [Prochlorococcus marinus str. SS35]KGG32264.1 hypothetical protein EV10_1379 [Prochlorococcus marinus str. SS51]KGG35045.1 hypothetical protein EV11_1447 [Prochlorococcus sp. SS52]
MEVLNNEEQELYLSLVGIDGWCKFYDKARRKCTVYKTRPSFCDVKNLCTTFKISESNTESFAIKCCKEQIKHIHGARSREMKRFISNIKQVK